MRSLFNFKPKRKKVMPSREMLRNLMRPALPAVSVTQRQEGAFPNKITRQIARMRERVAEAVRDTTARAKGHAARRRALLERQTRREKSGFYDGVPSVASMLGQRRGRVCRQKKELI